MKYPRSSNCLIYRRKDKDTYMITDGLTDTKWITGADAALFLQKLDGKTAPEKIQVNLTEEEKQQILDEMEEDELLCGHGRVSSFGIGSLLLTVWIPRKLKPGTAGAVLLNFLLLISWLPVLCSGLAAFLWSLGHGSQAERGSESWMLVTGYLLGLVLGMLLHEMAHAVAGLSSGRHIFEFGLLLMHFIPGAYVLMEERKGSRWQQAQIYGAGVEMNFLLAGLSAFGAVCWPQLYLLFSECMIVNILLGIGNLGFIAGTDGIRILENLLGAEDLADDADWIMTRKQRRKLIRKKGVNGYAQLLLYGVVKCCQLLMPLMLASSLLSFL